MLLRACMQALLAGYFLTACRFSSTEYDVKVADDRGTNLYAPFRAAHTGAGAAPARVAIDKSSVLAHVRPSWILYVSCVQSADGVWRVSDVLATDAESLHAAAPHVFDYAVKKAAAAPAL
jgi:hypothetical protein